MTVEAEEEVTLSALRREVGGLALSLVLALAAGSGCEEDEGFELEACDPADPSCPDGTTCRLVDGEEAYCLADCEGGGGGCPEGSVCHVFGDGSASCVLPCSEEEPCAEGFLCEPHDDGLMLCAEPLFLSGEVFDLADLGPVEGARVVAADETGAPVTDLAVTDGDGRYDLAVPSERDGDGAPVSIFTLRVAAADYQPYPYGIRPPIPVDAAEAQLEDGSYVVDNPTTDVGLIPLPEAERGLGSIEGDVLAEGAVGTLVVAEGGEAPSPYGFADLSGGYAIFNVPAGAYEVRGYAAFLELAPASVTLAEGEALRGVDLEGLGEAEARVTGQVNIVNADGSLATSVVLVPESTFDENFVRGEVPPGLRDPEPGLPPDVGGAFAIEGVPEGDYVVLAAFENDSLVRDPDPNIAGTQVVHVSVAGGAEVSLPDSFKITEALAVVSPGAEGPEPVSASPTFVFADDSSEDNFEVVVYDAFGVLVWEDLAVPRVTGSPTVEVPYGGPPLEPGMYYQFRATSIRRGGPISTTEDLRGVFYLPAEERSGGE